MEKNRGFKMIETVENARAVFSEIGFFRVQKNREIIKIDNGVKFLEKKKQDCHFVYLFCVCFRI